MTPLPDLRGCHHCGKSVRGDARRCPNCRAPLVTGITIELEFDDGRVRTEKSDTPVLLHPPDPE